MTEPLEAPEGFVAHDVGRKRWSCESCVALRDDKLCETLPCIPSERTDGRWVYFTRAVPAGGEG